MAEVSPRYLGSDGDSYHRAYGDLFKLRVASSLRALEPHLAVKESFLDFGCADGSLLEAIESSSKIGVEVNPVSRNVALGRGLAVHESLGDVGDDSIDVAFSSHVLEHTLRPFDELLGLGRVLRPGGTLVLMLPVDDWRTQKKWVLPENNHHLYTWTPQVLANLLSEAGFRVESIELLNYALPGRLTVRLNKSLPPPAFDLIARLTALVRRRRQLVAVAVVPNEGT